MKVHGWTYSHCQTFFQGEGAKMVKFILPIQNKETVFLLLKIL